MNEENKHKGEAGDQRAAASETGSTQQGAGKAAQVSDADEAQSAASGSSRLIDSGESLRQRIQRGPAAIIIASLCIFVIGLSVYFIVEGLGRNYEQGITGQDGMELDPSSALTLKLFFPLEGKVALEQRLVPKVTGNRDITAVAVREFLAGPSDEAPSYVPDAVALEGVYMGQDGVLYLDFSSSMTLNFQGDAVAEFLLLRSLYRTLNENTYGVKGYRLLVDGSEVDTIGGHLYILDGLERAVPYRLMEEDEIE